MNLFPSFDIRSSIFPCPNNSHPSMLWLNSEFTIIPPRGIWQVCASVWVTKWEKERPENRTMQESHKLRVKASVNILINQYFTTQNVRPSLKVETTLQSNLNIYHGIGYSWWFQKLYALLGYSLYKNLVLLKEIVEHFANGCNVLGLWISFSSNSFFLPINWMLHTCSFRNFVIDTFKL